MADDNLEEEIHGIPVLTPAQATTADWYEVMARHRAGILKTAARAVLVLTRHHKSPEEIAAYFEKQAQEQLEYAEGLRKDPARIFPEY